MDLQFGDIDVPLKMRVWRKNGDLEVLLGSATGMQIILMPPSGSSRTKTAVLATDGSDGIMQYTTVSGDINQTGRWAIQGKFSLGGGPKRTAVRYFDVKGNI
jgi:hypothetical protein